MPTLHLGPIIGGISVRSAHAQYSLHAFPLINAVVLRASQAPALEIIKRYDVWRVEIVFESAKRQGSLQRAFRRLRLLRFSGCLHQGVSCGMQLDTQVEVGARAPLQRCRSGNRMTLRNLRDMFFRGRSGKFAG